MAQIVIKDQSILARRPGKCKTRVKKRRSTLAARMVGLGCSELRTFCGPMNLPPLLILPMETRIDFREMLREMLEKLQCQGSPGRKGTHSR